MVAGCPAPLASLNGKCVSCSGQDSTGLPNVVYLFLVGMLTAQGTFIGFEA